MTLLAESTPKRITIDEFMALPDSDRYELVEGVLTERKLMGALSDYVAAKFVMRLGVFAEDHDAGHVFTADTTYHCFGHEATAKRADASFVARGRLPGERIPEARSTSPPMWRSR